MGFSQADVPMLVEALKVEDKFVRWAAVVALGRIGPEAKAARAAVVERLRDENRDVRLAAARSIGRIEPRRVIDGQGSGSGDGPQTGARTDVGGEGSAMELADRAALTGRR